MFIGLARLSCLNGLISSRPTLPRSWLLTMRIGTTQDWLPWPDTSISDHLSESQPFAKFTEVRNSEELDCVFRVLLIVIIPEFKI